MRLRYHALGPISVILLHIQHEFFQTMPIERDYRVQNGSRRDELEASKRFPLYPRNRKLISKSSGNFRARRLVKDDQSPKCIDCYLVEVENFYAAQRLEANEKKFKIEPQCLLYSLQWLHKGTPPDLHLQLVRDPTINDEGEGQ